MGQTIFTIVAAVAQLERDIIRELIKSSANNAENGKTLGRPMRIVDRETIAKMRAEGMSLQAIADKLGIGYGTVQKRLESLKQDAAEGDSSDNEPCVGNIRFARHSWRGSFER